MKATGKSGDAHTPESEDIAKLLRALNEDLKADPIDAAIDLDEDDEERGASRGLPLGKIAAALLAAAGIGVAVVMLDSGGAPTSPADTTALVAPAPAITRAPAAQSPTATPAPESMIARAPTPGAAPAAPPVSMAPAPPPAVAAPLTPPPALRVPEPPALPPAATVTKPAPAVRHAEALLPPVTPAPRAEPPRAEPPRTEPEAPPPPPSAAPKAPETGDLQAMLAPPKEPRDIKRAPAKPADSKPVETKTLETKPAAAKPLTGKPPASIPGGPYAVQLGTFKVAENAESLTRRLQGNGFSAYTLAWTDKSNQSWHAVRVGGYADSTAAKRAAGDVKTKLGLDAVVVTTR
ncbi:SPOR domain-containing protein [Azospirillum doebereinerae]